MFKKEARPERKMQKIRLYIDKYKDTPEVKDYFWWLSISDADKQDIIRRWEKYYADVKESRAYLRFQEQKAAWKAENMAKVKQLANEARFERETGNFLMTPTRFDPVWLKTSWPVLRYLQLTEALSKLNDDDSEEMAEFAGSLFQPNS